MYPLLKPVLHFLTSGILGLLVYFTSIKLLKKDSSKLALALALYSAILLHIFVDKMEWF